MKLILSLFLIALIGFQSCKEIDEKRPNIILIMTDDQGSGDVGFNGNKKIITPHLDSMATAGVILNRFYSASAVCSPTRASLITGRNPLRMNIPYANTGFMKKEEITLPEILKKEGYHTGHFGKWHLGTFTTTELDANRGGRPEHNSAYTIPTDHGYDTFFATESKVPTYDPMVFPDSFSEGEGKRFGWKAMERDQGKSPYGTNYWTDKEQKATENLEGDNSRIIMDRVLPFIDQSLENKQSFFTTIWLHTPHLPVVSDSLHRSLYDSLSLEEQIYYGSITAMDEQIGRLWKSLESNNIQEETIIFFCSDNGPERNTPGSAGPYRARKRSLYEGGVRVPAFMIWKGNVPGNRKVDYPMVTSDYLPTIVDILGLEYNNKRPLDGKSFFKAIQGLETEREDPIGFICQPQVSWLTDQYKLIGEKELDSFELYDILNDPYEKNNIIDQKPEIAKELEIDLRTWLLSVENSKREADYQ